MHMVPSHAERQEVLLRAVTGLQPGENAERLK